MKRFILSGLIFVFSIRLYPVMVTIELRNSQGELTDTGSAAYYSGTWIDLGTTSGGIVTADLPAANLKFRMTYMYGVNEKYQNTDSNPIVTFQTVNTEVRLIDSQSAFLDTGSVKYYAGGWHDFGITQNGLVSLELLPLNYKFRMTYAHASNEKYQQTGTDPVVIFQTVDTKVRLIDSQSAALDTGSVEYYVGGWWNFGTTENGSVSLELLPYNYKFRMTYAHASNEKYQQTGTDPVVIFQTVNTEARLIDSQSALLDTGTVQYYSGGWHEFGTTENGSCFLELLPNNYKFRMTYAFASNEKYQQTGTDPLILFPTVHAIIHVNNLQGQPVTGADVKYYSGGWHTFGTTVSGTAGLELLPKNYKFRVTYEDQVTERYADIGTEPEPVFEIDAPGTGTELSLSVFDPWEGFNTDEDSIRVNGQVSDPAAEVRINGQAAAVNSDGRFIKYVNITEGQNTITVIAELGTQSVTEIRHVTYTVPVLPPDPADVAPPVDPTVVTTVARSTEFLYRGPDPIQTGVDTASMEPVRAAVIRGNVLAFEGVPLPNVTVTIKDHPEFGTTKTRADGRYDMAVNGGGVLNLQFEKTGYLTAQRKTQVPWQDWVVMDTVALMRLDPNVTRIDFSDTIEVSLGSVITDEDGTRQAVLLFT